MNLVFQRLEDMIVTLFSFLSLQAEMLLLRNSTNINVVNLDI